MYVQSHDQRRGHRRGRGQGRGRGRGGPDFQQYSSDGDLNMNETRSFAPRERGRGNHDNRIRQQHPFDSEGDQAMQDTNSSRSRGRGRGWNSRGGQNTYQSPYQRDERDQRKPNSLDSANPAVQLMKDFLGRRYDASNKLLNLSAVASDDPIRQAGVFATEATQKKFFPALMVVCEDMLATQEAKEEAIQSVTLCDNNLENTHAVYKLCWQLNHIKNLDLSKNKFATLDALKPWKGRFKNLEHLIVDPFPRPGWEDELTSWYPKLKILNNTQVRPGATTASNSTVAVRSNVPAEPVQGRAISNDDQRKEEMILYVQQQTNLKRDYAIQCLEAGHWNIEQAGLLFTQSQPTLPAEAYI